MTPSQGGELAIILFCAAIYIVYHGWVFCYDHQPKGTIKVMRAARNARRVWARSILSDDKETITGDSVRFQACRALLDSGLCEFQPVPALIAQYCTLLTALHVTLQSFHGPSQ